MNCKDKKGFVIYVLISLVLWQLCVSVSKILKSPYFINQSKGDIISISMTTNKGAAFGILNDNPYMLGILGVIVLIVTVFFVYKKLKFEDKTKILYTSIFTSGILGNTIERLQYGYVSDYLKINLFDFPIFNLFDVLICISVILFIIETFKKRSK